MGTEEKDIVLFERIGKHIALVTLNRPEKYNAVNSMLTNRLFDILTQIEEDKDLWAAVLTSSNNKVFCAGADLAEVASGKGQGISHPEGGFAGLVEAKRKKPWIAAVVGAALGGGCEISLACDMIVCGQSSVIGLPEVKRSLIAGAGGLYRLPRVIPRAVAIEMITTGEPVDANRAAELGLVNRVAPDADVVNEALKLAEKICENAPLAVFESLAIARKAKELSEAECQPIVMQAFGRLSKTKDFQEGPKAFLEKRAPQWTGE